nr:hypothetical protein [Klebsiella pneumoniae]MDM8700375.1 hypothetical protein [Klebsiella pneumoniae]MDM9235809.1 hypothetical protein [Klebsiella pneumoniae]
MDIIQELTKAGITVATTQLFNRVFALWDRTNLNARRLVRELNSRAYINYLEKHVSRVVSLRTIHSSEYDVQLKDMYHPLRIRGVIPKEGANKQVISSQADSLIKISRIWAD